MPASEARVPFGGADGARDFAAFVIDQNRQRQSIRTEGAHERQLRIDPSPDTFLRYEGALLEHIATLARIASARGMASALTISDVGLIPLHYQINVWAMRRGISYRARTDESTVAQFFQPAN